MMESLKSITEIPDLRRRMLFTLAMLAVYRLGAVIPTPGINAEAFEQMFNQSLGGGLFGLLAMFSGGSLKRMTVFALGIMPYITASIILQLLGVVSPTLEKLKKEGELGRKKITEYTRWLTVALSAFQGFGIAVALQRQGSQLVTNPGPGFVIATVLTLTTGAVFIMWLGEQITSRGIGNGMSLLIFAGIVAGLPRGVADLYEKVFVTRVWSSAGAPAPTGVHGGDCRLYCARGTRGAARAHPIREAHRGAKSDGGRINPPSAESEQRGRDADHLCRLDSDLPANHRVIHGEEQRRGEADHRSSSICSPGESPSIRSAMCC